MVVALWLNCGYVDAVFLFIHVVVCVVCVASCVLCMFVWLLFVCNVLCCVWLVLVYVTCYENVFHVFKRSLVSHESSRRRVPVALCLHSLPLSMFSVCPLVF